MALRLTRKLIFEMNGCLGIHERFKRPLKNAPFCSISASGSNFNPRNTQCIRAYPVKCEAYFSGVVKIIGFLVLKQKLTFFKGLEKIHNGNLCLICSIFLIF